MQIADYVLYVLQFVKSASSKDLPTTLHKLKINRTIWAWTIPICFKTTWFVYRNCCAYKFYHNQYKMFWYKTDISISCACWYHVVVSILITVPQLAQWNLSIAAQTRHRRPSLCSYQSHKDVHIATTPVTVIMFLTFDLLKEEISPYRIKHHLPNVIVYIT